MPEEEKEKKLEFLKREEIRTMEKDIASLREKEAQKERERVAELKTAKEAKIERERAERIKKEEEERKIIEEEVKRKTLEKVERAKKEKEKKLLEFVGEKTKEICQKAARKEKKRVAELKEKEIEKEKVEPRPVSLIPKPPKRPSLFVKILVRGAIIAIILFLLGFFYWYFAIKKAELPLEKVLPPVEEEIVEKPEISEPEVPTTPSVIKRILDWGYHIPTVARTIDTIIIHSVYNALGGDVHSIEGVIQEYNIYKVAAHYLITRDGLIYQTVPDKAVAYHAGFSEMPDGRINVNDFSIGIEVIYTKTESPTETQYQALSQLVKYLREQYNVPFENILGHKDIAPGRKTDPWNFNWGYFQSLIYEPR